MKATSILDNMELQKTPIEDWTNEDLDVFLFDLKTISFNTIQLYVHMVRKCHKLACKVAGKVYVQLTPTPTHDFNDYVDLKLFRSVTLTESEFNRIRNELKYVDVAYQIEGNFRDVALIDLAWYGLTSKEIKWLRMDDVKVIEGGISLTLYLTEKVDKGIEQLSSELNRVVIIDDNEIIIEDILKAKRETSYWKVRSYEAKGYTQVQECFYTDSPYFIRGIENGNTIPNRPITHIGMLIYKQLKKLQIPNLNIDLEHLSVEDIRRSMLINLILKEDIPIVSLQAMLNKKRDADLQWLKTIAKKLRDSGLM